MTRLPYYILDVFAEQKNAGNELAVFRDAAGLSTDEMQVLALEMHYSRDDVHPVERAQGGGCDVLT